MARAITDLRSVARDHTELAMRTLRQVATNKRAPAAARVAAAGMLLDRGWGKPPTTHAGANGEADLRVTIRHILDGEDRPEQAKVIDLVPMVIGLDEDEGEED